MLASYYVIGVYYTTPDMKASRHEEYLADLQDYVTKNHISSADSNEIAEWVRDNPHVYLLVYQSVEAVKERETEGDVAPAPTDRLTEYVGSRVDGSLDRDLLVSAALEGGYKTISLTDGSVTVALAEYTENLYYTAFNLISIIAAALVFILFLVRYIRVLIARIKRFESDVTIVSEIDMDYVIVSEGADEIANLSTKVEEMRQRMLEHIKSEQEARQTNSELIASISHDLRTPLTVLMGYIEMMKKHEADEIMEGYVSATESTALRLKQLADDMFRYSLAFGDTEKSVNLEEYDAATLIDQLFAEHFLLMREMGYDIRLESIGEPVKEGSVLRTDAPNLMRIIDNIFSNLRKYAEINEPVFFCNRVENNKLCIECKNKIRTDTEGAESNGIGLKTCVRLASLIADKFEYESDGEYFTCRLVIDIREGGEE